MDLPVVGIDIAKKKFDVTLLVAGKAKSKTCANKPEGFLELLNWIDRHAKSRVHACMEATNTYGEALALALAEAGHVVSLVNPARIQAFAGSELVRTKSDRADAGLIARFCAAMHPEPWSPPSPDVRELQALVRRLDALNDMLLQEQNRQDGGIPSESVAGSIKQVIQVLEREIEEIERQIQGHFDQHSGLKSQRDLLTTIPGIGEKTAAIILAELRCVADYASARQVAAYCGLTPREYTSGTSVRRRSRLSKVGNARLRRALYFPAIVSLRHNPIIAAFADRLRQRQLTGKALVGAAMRKLLHIAFGVLKNGKPFDPNHLASA